MQHGWSPYRYGHWIWTDDGWYWDSDEPYGNIVYHYGRWYNDDYYGWIWVPDNEWAPAWVEWRYNDNYIGWAPLTPYASFSIGIGINFSNNYETPYSYWHFVGYNRMCDPNVYNYYVPDHDRYRVYSDTRYRTNYGYSNGRVINRGVDVDYIRQRGGGRIVENHIQRVDDPRNAGGRAKDNVVRAFIPTREQMVRNDNRNVEIKRATRPSTLDISKVNIGSRNPVTRNENNSAPNREINRSENNAPSREAPANNQNNSRVNNRQQNNIQKIQPENGIQNTQSGRANKNQVRSYSRPQQNVQSQQQQRVQRQPQQLIQSQPQVRQQGSAPRQNVQQNNVQRRESAPQVKRESSNNNK
ncbi:MAG: hypothetical protein P4L45_09170, partial [Ignavibacteriaceae bacterium]|nr:hypothetical protein [Ignavibacteriaceae bacterium]